MTTATVTPNIVKDPEFLVNREGQVAVIVDAFDSAPKSYKVRDAKQRSIEILLDDGSRHVLSMPPHAAEAWQLLVDTEQLLVTELEPDRQAFRRDDWIYPER